MPFCLLCHPGFSPTPLFLFSTCFPRTLLWCHKAQLPPLLTSLCLTPRRSLSSPSSVFSGVKIICQTLAARRSGGVVAGVLCARACVSDFVLSADTCAVCFFTSAYSFKVVSRRAHAIKYVYRCKQSNTSSPLMCHLLKCGSSDTLRLLNWEGPWLWTVTGLWLSLPYSDACSRVTILIGKSKASATNCCTADTLHAEVFPSIRRNPLGKGAAKIHEAVRDVTDCVLLKRFYLFISHTCLKCDVLATASSFHFQNMTVAFTFRQLVGLFFCFFLTVCCHW